LVTKEESFAEKIGRNPLKLKKVAQVSRWKRSDRPAPFSKGDSQSTKEGYPRVPEIAHGNVRVFKGRKGSF
jgi:hypothetical protein